MRNPDCTQCPLWESAETVCLWGSGPANSRLMVVGEAPGKDEDRSGSPFKGRSGRLLHQLMEEAGLSQTRTYHTYVVKCRPPEGMNPKPSEVKACKPFLEEEIQDIRPDYVLVLGATALKAVTRKAKITEMHGQVVEVSGVRYFPSFHPAMALRDPSKMEPLRKDLIRLRQIMDGTLGKEKSIEWEVIRTMEQWDQFLVEFRESKVTAFDIETTGLDKKKDRINSIQLTLDTDRTFSLPLNIRDSPWSEGHHQVFIETLVEISQDQGMEMVGQNGKFDNTFLMEKYGVKFRLGFDTMLASHTLDENVPHGLKELATSHCDAPAYDIDLKTKLGQGDLERFYKYGCLDTYYTLQLRHKFRRQLLKDPGLRRLFYRLVMPSARMFEDIEMEGHFLNLPLLEQSRKELTRKRNNYERRLNGLAGREVNWNSPKQVAKVLFEEQGLSVLDKTPGGDPSTSESVLLRLPGEIPSLLIKMRGVEKNLSTYINGWESLTSDGYLYISTKLHGTVTGRYASRLHQVPRDPAIRSLIDAPDGWSFICADYSQIELRLVAMASGDMRMRQAYLAREDLHAQTASEALGVSKENLTKEQRKMAKAINFGFVYEMWWKKFMIYCRDNYGIEVTASQAQKFRERFFEIYAGLKPWHERCRRVVRALGEVTSLSGRRRRLPGVHSTDKDVRQEAERQAINSPIQGFGSGDLKAMAMVEIHKTFDRDVLRVKGEVHDSILMWIRTDRLEETLPNVKKIMESPALLKDFGIKMTVPIEVDFEIGPWGLGEKWKFDSKKS